MTHVLLIAPGPVDRYRMGPAIRYWEFARTLSAAHTVTLLVPNEDHPTHPDFTVCITGEGDLETLVTAHEVVVIQGPALQQHPRLAQLVVEGHGHLVVDLYDPITLEQLEMAPGSERSRWLLREYTALLNEQLRLGDFFLCASERQRDYWLGALAALGRINHDTYDGADLRRLVTVLPFGLPAQPPQPGDPVLKGVSPGIAPTDRMILWGGGLWDWLDPLTPVRAMQQVAASHPTARLVFFEAERGRMAMAERTRQLAVELGLLDRHILFVDWVAPEQWGACLLEADVGLSFHPASIETHFAFRTRLLDYIWAGLPIVTAAGDVLSKWVTAHDLGYVVEPGNVQGLSAALIALLEEPQARPIRRDAFRQVARRFTWEQVMVPLRNYCCQPWHAGDAERAFDRRRQAAEREQLLSDVAHAERRRIEAEARIDELTHRLQHSEAQFQAAMNGRVMRLMTRLQRALRRPGGGGS